MGMGKRRQIRQVELWAAAALPRGGVHPFYDRVNERLNDNAFATIFSPEFRGHRRSKLKNSQQVDAQNRAQNTPRNHPFSRKIKKSLFPRKSPLPTPKTPIPTPRSNPKHHPKPTFFRTLDPYYIRSTTWATTGRPQNRPPPGEPNTTTRPGPSAGIPTMTNSQTQPDNQRRPENPSLSPAAATVLLVSDVGWSAGHFRDALRDGATSLPLQRGASRSMPAATPANPCPRRDSG